MLPDFRILNPIELEKVEDFLNKCFSHCNLYILNILKREKKEIDLKNIIFEINNVKGIDMQKYSNYPQEKEVLLSRGKTYKIKKMTNKGEYLYIVIE